MGFGVISSVVIRDVVIKYQRCPSVGYPVDLMLRRFWDLEKHAKPE